MDHPLRLKRIETPKSRQQAIVNHLKRGLLQKNIKVVKYAGIIYHLRIHYDGDVMELLNSILDVSIDPSAIMVSSKFSTNIMTILRLEQPLKAARIGDQIYFVNTFSPDGKSVSDKDFTPEYFGLNGNSYKKQELIHFVKSKITTLVSDSEMGTFLNLLLDSTSSMNYDFTFADHESLSSKDYPNIMKNFGEVLSPIYAMNTRAVEKVSFPKDAYNELTDFSLYEYDNVSDIPMLVKTPVSVKYKDGSASSIRSAAKVLSNITYKDANLVRARKMIITINDSMVEEGILNVAKTLRLDAYRWLSEKITGQDGDPTVEDLKIYMDAIGTAAQFKIEFQEFFDILGKAPKDSSITEIYSKNLHRRGLLISPLGYKVVDILNGDTSMMMVLNDAVSMIDAKFVRVKLENSGAMFHVSYNFDSFKGMKNKFKFSYNGNSKKPSLKKIAFMVNV